MSFDIPATMEPEVVRYAKLKRISRKEAIARLVQAGLAADSPTQQVPNAILSGLGMFADPDEAAILDEAVAIAYEERRSPPKRFS